MRFNAVHSSLNFAEENTLVKNEKFLRYLKYMVFFGYLPFTWIEQDEPDSSKSKFKISFWKSILIVLVDLSIVLVMLAYVPVWHILNLGPTFDLSLILKTDYYVKVFGGTMTTVLSEFIFIFYPSMCWWIFIVIGLFTLILLI